ncbi:MAG: GyrI-like domain-containing protein [Bdellovibrionaceae bacterium]|nr:GyrI-like domain-containing protein [Pseudobdellovibrionaceae bacterium]
MRLVVLGLILFVLGGAVFLSVRNGVFMPVRVNIEERGPFLLVYKTHVGPYHKIMPTLETVEKWARETGFHCERTFGEFIDDPNLVEVERLHSNVGCLQDLSGPDVQNLLANRNLPEDFKVKEIPAQRFVVATFEGSPALGPYKVYGKAHDVMIRQRLEPNGPVIEIYQTVDNIFRTLYLFPVK